MSVFIDDNIFDMYPGFYRGIVIVDKAEIKDSDNRVRKLLKNMISERLDVSVEDSEHIRAWDDAHRLFGSDPQQFYPSIKSLALRIKAGQGLPFINTVVALMNYISLKYLLPCGGDDIDSTENNLFLRLANGDEKFYPLGQNPTLESPETNEVIYVDGGNNVLCRRWNWRNGNVSKITSESKKILLNIDCLPPLARYTANEARDEFADLLKTHCNASVKVDFLCKEKNCIEF